MPAPPRNLVAECDDDVGAPLDRAVQVRRRDRRVDDERQLVRVRHIRRGPRGRRSRRTGWRSSRRTPPWSWSGDRGGVVGGVGAADERGVDAEPAQGHVELGDRAAVEVRGRDDVVAGAGERREGDELRREPTARSRPRRGRSRGRDALLEAWPRSGSRAGCRCCRTSAARSGPPHPQCRRRRTRWSGRSAARARTARRVGDVARVNRAGLEPRRYSLVRHRTG